MRAICDKHKMIIGAMLQRKAQVEEWTYNTNNLGYNLGKVIHTVHLQHQAKHVFTSIMWLCHLWLQVRPVVVYSVRVYRPH